MSPTDLEVIAPLTVEYFKWLKGEGGTSPEDLLSQPLTRSQRRMLLERMDDVLVVWGLTAPVRNAIRRRTHRQID